MKLLYLMLKQLKQNIISYNIDIYRIKFIILISFIPIIYNNKSNALINLIVNILEFGIYNL